MDACTNPDILRVIYFCLLIIDVVKIIIPIALIVLGIIDFSKSVITTDEKVQKKSLNLFLKRLLYAVLVFAVPWIVEVLMVTLGDLLGGEKVNFTDCIQNANSETIESLENSEGKCNGKTFVITYYEEDKTTVKESTTVCTNEEITFKWIDDRRNTLKGWDFKNNSTGDVVFKTHTKYVITEEFLKSIENSNGGFKLYPIWEK